MSPIITFNFRDLRHSEDESMFEDTFCMFAQSPFLL